MSLDQAERNQRDDILDAIWLFRDAHVSGTPQYNKLGQTIAAINRAQTPREVGEAQLEASGWIR